MKRVSRSLIAVALSASLPGVALAQERTLPVRLGIDRAHSTVGFAVRFMGMSTVRGAFTEYDGTIMYVPDAVERSTASIVITANSINTNGGDRDRHLRSPDFFDVEQYPYITFRSTRVRRTAEGLLLEGELTMHGVTRPVAIPVTIMNPPAADAWGNSRATFSGQLRVSRRDFDIRGTAFWNSEFDPGRFAVSDEVEIELLISATVPNVERWGHPQGDSLLRDIEAHGVEDALRAWQAAHGPAAIDSLPDFALLMAAEKLMVRNRMADAIKLYETIVLPPVNRERFRFRLGEAYLRAGQVQKALAEFAAAARRAPNNTAATEWLRHLER